MRVSICRAQQSDPLEQQLQELKQQYAETTRALEQRIAALEQQIEKQKAAAAAPKEGTVSAAELAKEAAEKTVLVAVRSGRGKISGRGAFGTDLRPAERGRSKDREAAAAGRAASNSTGTFARATV